MEDLGELERLPQEVLIEILFHIDVNDYINLSSISELISKILNSRNFWVDKFKYEGYSRFVFDFFDDEGDLEDYIYSYELALDYKKRVGCVLFTMAIESQYQHYAKNYIVIDIENDIMLYDYFLEYNGITLEDIDYKSLTIKKINNSYNVQLNKEDPMLFNEKCLTEFLMVYLKISDHSIKDQYGLRYLDRLDYNDVMGTRRAGIAAVYFATK